MLLLAAQRWRRDLDSTSISDGKGRADRADRQVNFSFLEFRAASDRFGKDSGVIPLSGVRSDEERKHDSFERFGLFEFGRSVTNLSIVSRRCTCPQSGTSCSTLQPRGEASTKRVTSFGCAVIDPIWLAPVVSPSKCILFSSHRHHQNRKTQKPILAGFLRVFGTLCLTIDLGPPKLNLLESMMG